MAADIVTKQAFLDQVAGRRLIQGDSWVIITPQGTVEGMGPDRNLVSGSWSWEDRFYCRTIHFDGKDLPEDLQVVTVEGDQVSFVHDRGNGDTMTWTIT